MTLTVFAESWVGVVPVPQSLDLGRLRPGVSLETFVQLQREGQCSISNHRHVIRSGRFEANDRWSGGSRLTGPPRSGQLQGWEAERRDVGALKIRTDRADASVVAIPLAGEVVGPVSITPSVLHIDRDDIGKVVKRVLLLKNEEGGSEPRLQGVKVSAPWELTRLETKSPGRSVYLWLDLGLRFPNGSGAPSGELELTVRFPAFVHCTRFL